MQAVRVSALSVVTWDSIHVAWTVNSEVSVRASLPSHPHKLFIALDCRLEPVFLSFLYVLSLPIFSLAPFVRSLIAEVCSSSS